MRPITLLLLCTSWLGIAFFAQGASEVVVAIRYLQAEGVSHSHLYLYREDGKLLRQLTTENTGQDTNPAFAPDGESILFTRELKDRKQVWSIEPLGKNLKQLTETPDWYTNLQTAPGFIWPDLEETSGTDGSKQEFGSRHLTYTAPDGSASIEIRELTNDEEDQVNGPGHGKHYRLQNLKTGHSTDFGSIPGFEGVYDLLAEQGSNRRFFFEPGLRLVFFGLHLDSTNGDTSYALDLNEPRLVRLSPNWAAPIALPGEPAFLAYVSNRYVPIPGSTKTANCTYVERWNDKLQPVRFAKPGSAAICYGFSVYRPKPLPEPRVITVKP